MTHRSLSALLGLAGAVALGFLGCASSTPFTGECNPTKQTCACSASQPCPSGWDCVNDVCVATGQDGGGDLPSSPDLGADRGTPDLGVDLPPKKGFGEACGDKAECATSICLFAGTGGICSKLCSAGTCPPGYGCLGVTGALEPGKVSDVCVPNSNQLCSPCQKDTECALGGGDKCVDVDGGTYCARDCSVIACPSGYACTKVDIGGQSFDQCLPQNGACDCDAKTTGTTKKCTLTTPFGTCEGFKSCQGLPGWGVCEPPQPTDTPDGAYGDENCDGIDGDITQGIFVSTTGGTDDATCGKDYLTPCKTVGKGIQRAKAETREHVYVQAGQYDEVVLLEGGIHLWGGYDTNWKRGPRSQPAHETTIKGKLDTVTDQYVTIRALLLAKPTTVADFILVGADAQGANAKGTRSSVVVHADTAPGLNFERVTLRAGNGANGSSGIGGLSAPIVVATAVMKGAKGGDATESFSTCNSGSRGAGGAAGSNSCSGGLATAGGSGGDGGTMDTCCDCLFGACTCVTCNCDATNGVAGSNAGQYTTNGYGYRGGGGAGQSTCGVGLAGKAGRVQNGSKGSGGSGGLWLDGFWYAKNGTVGGKGEHGGGGGGGGGSGGCDVNTDSTGAGGGGGGAGGCAASSGGAGGTGGGGSFAVLADASNLTLTDCEIQLGNGGRGGDGGAGGRGQSGGGAGLPGLGKSGASDAGPGGAGGHGGHGGGGGGGAGGIAYGIYTHKSIVTENCTYSGGSAGGAGSGGASAPTAPVSERDGNNGDSGSAAPAPAHTAVCTDVANCN